MAAKPDIEARTKLLQGYLEAYKYDLANAEKDGNDVLAAMARMNIKSVKSTIRTIKNSQQ